VLSTSSSSSLPGTSSLPSKLSSTSGVASVPGTDMDNCGQTAFTCPSFRQWLQYTGVDDDEDEDEEESDDASSGSG